MPGTLNLEETDIDFGFDLARESRAVQRECALSNSFGFGGVNVSLLFRAVLRVCL